MEFLFLISYISARYKCLVDNALDKNDFVKNFVCFMITWNVNVNRISHKTGKSKAALRQAFYICVENDSRNSA